MILPQWPAPDNVKALATEREISSSISPKSDSNSIHLGVSLPPYDSFNLGDHVGDNPVHVSANRKQLLQNSGVLTQSGQSGNCDEIRWLQQVHGIDCLDAALIKDSTLADACFTQQHKLACAIMTADCLPVLFCDLKGTQVAAAHAGWKGLAAGVLEQTLNRFINNGIAAKEVIAWLGPAITQSAFEVGPEVQSAFLNFNNGEKWADDACFVAGKDDRLQADLYRLAKLQLEHLGVAGVYGDDEYCTFSAHNTTQINDSAENNQHRFFSYRRQTITGRQASLIWLA